MFESGSNGKICLKEYKNEFEQMYSVHMTCKCGYCACKNIGIYVLFTWDFGEDVSCKISYVVRQIDIVCLDYNWLKARTETFSVLVRAEHLKKIKETKSKWVDNRF